MVGDWCGADPGSLCVALAPANPTVALVLNIPESLAVGLPLKFTFARAVLWSVLRFAAPAAGAWLGADGAPA